MLGISPKWGKQHVVEDLSKYFEKQRQLCDFQQVICIAGNHDITFHPEYYEKTWSRHLRGYDAMETRAALNHCEYLEDSSTNLVRRTTGHDSSSCSLSSSSLVYGSPWTPNFFHWAFNLQRGEPLQRNMVEHAYHTIQTY